MSEQENPIGRVIVKCWQDAAFKARLLADPLATLKAEGVKLPDGVAVNVVEDTKSVLHLVLPAPPEELSDEQLSQMSRRGCSLPGVATPCCGGIVG